MHDEKVYIYLEYMYIKVWKLQTNPHITLHIYLMAEYGLACLCYLMAENGIACLCSAFIFSKLAQKKKYEGNF